MNPFKVAPKLLAQRHATKRTAIDRLNIVAAIVAVSLFSALVMLAADEAAHSASVKISAAFSLPRLGQ